MILALVSILTPASLMTSDTPAIYFLLFELVDFCTSF
jgi:hypothetical protein